MSEEEIKIAYVHVPIFYNAKPKTENVSNTIQETENMEQKDIPIPFGVLLILLAISILVLMFWRWE